MISARPRPIRRVTVPTSIPTRLPEASRDVAVRRDPADLATALRDVAARAHRGVRALDAASGREDATTMAIDALRDLAELHPEIVQLQGSVEAESQQDLASYLAALRREVESRLG